MMFWDPKIYTRTRNLATHAHNGQPVPGTDPPYINHIGNVAMEGIITQEKFFTKLKDVQA